MIPADRLVDTSHGCSAGQCGSRTLPPSELLPSVDHDHNIVFVSSSSSHNSRLVLSWLPRPGWGFI